MSQQPKPDSKKYTDLISIGLQLWQVIKKHLGSRFEKYKKITFPKIENKSICYVSIAKCGTPSS